MIWCMLSISLSAVLNPEESGGYVALCPELDIASQGESIEQAMHNLKEAVEGFSEVASPAEIETVVWVITDTLFCIALLRPTEFSLRAAELAPSGSFGQRSGAVQRGFDGQGERCVRATPGHALGRPRGLIWTSLGYRGLMIRT